LTLAKNIKSRAGPTPVMFLVTGFADVAPAEAYDIGVEGFIYKPFNLGPVMENLARALQGLDKRWNQEIKAATIKKLPLTGSLVELVSSGALSLGRGGAFVRGVFSEIRAQDTLRVELSDGGVLIGVVRWIQYENIKDSQAGLGMEFQNISEDLRHQLIEQVQKTPPQSYIPRK
jgi:hypothetical protein